jgi:hypothetical protein
MSFLSRAEKKSNGSMSPQSAVEAVHADRRYLLSKGRGHIVEEPQGSLCYELLARLLSDNSYRGKLTGLIVSRQHPNMLREKYGFAGTPIIWLATQAGESTMDPSSLGMLAHSVSEFLSKNKDGIVLLDGIEYLITSNDFRKVVRAIEQINDSVMNFGGYLIMTLDPKTFDQKELAILERYFDVIHPWGYSGNML